MSGGEADGRDVLVSTDLAVAYIVGQVSDRTVAQTGRDVLDSIHWMIYNRCREGKITNHGTGRWGGALWSLNELDEKIKEDRACLWPRNVR